MFEIGELSQSAKVRRSVGCWFDRRKGAFNGMQLRLLTGRLADHISLNFRLSRCFSLLLTVERSFSPIKPTANRPPYFRTLRKFPDLEHQILKNFSKKPILYSLSLQFTFFQFITSQFCSLITLAHWLVACRTTNSFAPEFLKFDPFIRGNFR